MLSLIWEAIWATLGNMHKTPPIILKFGRCVICMMLDENVQKNNHLLYKNLILGIKVY